MDYQIVAAKDVLMLGVLVNELCNKGWMPCGGVAISNWHSQWENERKGYTESETRSEYAQAMTSTKASRETAARLRDY